VATRKAKSDAQKKRESAAKAKEKAKDSVSPSFGNVRDRMFDGERMQGVIRRYAYGKEVDRSLPEGVSMPSSPDTIMADADAADDAARVLDVDRLAGILKMKQEGVNTADPEGIVRRAYNFPDVSPSTSKGPLGHYVGDRKTTPTLSQASNVVDSRLAELTRVKDFESFRQQAGLRSNSRPDRVFEAMVAQRSRKFNTELAPWYEGAPTGETTPEGSPIYAEGESRKVINRIAAQNDLDADEVRRGTAMGSPKSQWSTRAGGYPNVEGAAAVQARAKQEPDLSSDEIAVPRGEGDPISGIGLTARRKAVAEMARGEHSLPTQQIKPAQGSAIPSPKQSNFDVGLTSPHSDRYGYSSWIAAERSKAFTSDTHDLGVAGIKTPGRVKVDPVSGEEKRIKSAAEEWLEKPGSYDLSRASATASLGDRFSEQFRDVQSQRGLSGAQDWARKNAHAFTANNAQAAWWVTQRGWE
jgi:hypothetical protein